MSRKHQCRLSRSAELDRQGVPHAHAGHQTQMNLQGGADRSKPPGLARISHSRSPAKRVDTSVDAADVSVRATSRLDNLWQTMWRRHSCLPRPDSSGRAGCEISGLVHRFKHSVTHSRTAGEHPKTRRVGFSPAAVAVHNTGAGLKRRAG